MSQKTIATQARKPRFGIIRGTYSELRKVVWLSRRELLYLTGLVLLVVLVFGIVLGVLDYGFTQLVNRVFIG